MSVVIERPAGEPSWPSRREYPFASHHLHVEGGSMHFVDEGKGEPIVFVHGWPTWSYLWRHQIRELASSYRCVAPDLIGFGLSDKPTDFVHSPAAHCRNLGRLIDELGLEGITLVLHDFGGPIGLSYAVDHPGRVRRLVLSNTWCWDLSGDEVAARLGKVVGGAVGKFMVMRMNLPCKNLRAQFGEGHLPSPGDAAAYDGPFEKKEHRLGAWAMARHLLQSGPWYDDVWVSRHELDGKPMLFLWGMKDAAFGERCLNKFWHEFPLAEVERFETAGHCLPEEKPSEVLRAIRAFLGAPTGAPDARLI